MRPLLNASRLKLGVLLGQTVAIAADATQRASLDTMLKNIIASSAIEGEHLDRASVRSSLAQRLGLVGENKYPVTDRSEGLGNILFDTTTQSQGRLSRARLFRWHRWLFPGQGRYLRVGKLRGPGPMQVVSGRSDKPNVHFVAPPFDIVDQEVRQFVTWFNSSRDGAGLDMLLRAALVHLRFVTLHPFDDGNGRLARALTDLALAQFESSSVRLCAMSVPILNRRKEYYEALSAAQHGTCDVTAWVVWFLQVFVETVDEAIEGVARTLNKAEFWQHYQASGFHRQQVKVLNRLLDGGAKGFGDGISAGQYSRVGRVSKATATRHLRELVNCGCIKRLPGGGRNTRYVLAPLA